MATNQNEKDHAAQMKNLIARSNLSPEDIRDNGTSDNESVMLEEFKISGDALVGKAKELIQQRNAHRVIIKNEKGRTLIEMPLNVGAI